MYEKIATVMNRDYGATDISADEVEAYLRRGETAFITADEASLIERLLERYI